MPPSAEQSYVADSVTSPLLGAEEKLLFTEDGEPIFVTGDEDERQPKELPKEVQELMDKLALQKVGELQVIDCPALESLKDGEWMTVAAESKDELDWETLWKDKIAWHQEATGGWGPPLKLQASIVTTKDACAVGDRGVLRHLLKEAWANSCNEAIFGSGGIRAIVNYKWTSYARAFTIAQLVCYSAWVLSFTGFVLLTNSGIQSEHRPAESARAGWHGPAHPTLAYALLLASTALMAPFAALEARTIWVYRSYYAKRQILADLMDLAIMLNHTAILGLVLYNAMSKASVEGDVDIDILIAVQVTLLWAKLPYFFKGFDLGRFAPIDTFEHVVWEARYMLLFILFMMFGFGVGYTTLFQKPEDVDPDVGQLAHSIITMFVICKGMGVNIKEMYESRHNVAVIIFFVAFEFLISIVMLNTLISIMVGAFDRMKETSIAETVMRRAELIDEVDCAMQGLGLAHFRSPPYLHVLSVPDEREEEVSICERLHRLKLSVKQMEERVVGRLQEIVESATSAHSADTSAPQPDEAAATKLDPAAVSSVDQVVSEGVDENAPKEPPTSE